MMIKSVPASFQAKAEGEPEGTFEALVSVFGNVDFMGDRVVKGAFTDTLDTWQKSGNPIPVVWSHQSYDPDMNIGQVLDAEERDAGLWVKAQVDLDAPKAAQVYRLLAAKRVTQFSFAYDIDQAEDVDGVQELKALTLYEVGPTPLGANPATELLDVKMAHQTVDLDALAEVLRNTSATKAGRVLSAANETKLRDAAQMILDICSQVGEGPGDAGESARAEVALQKRVDFQVALRRLADLDL